MTATGRVLAALAAVALTWPLAGCDAGGDGFDGTTGRPVTAGTPAGGTGPADALSLGTAAAGTRWVVEGVAYAGPKGGPGRHYAMCVPDVELGRDPRGLWKEVDVHSDDGSLDRGDPCPPGGTIYDDGPVRADSGGRR